jgi:hypothetical protein
VNDVAKRNLFDELREGLEAIRDNPEAVDAGFSFDRHFLQFAGCRVLGITAQKFLAPRLAADFAA